MAGLSLQLKTGFLLVWSILTIFLLINEDFLCLLIIFADSLDPDQAQQNFGPDLDPNCLNF